MKTECAEKTEFQGLGNRHVTGKSDGGTITSDGGGILLREAEEITGVVRRFPDCFAARFFSLIFGLTQFASLFSAPNPGL